jgi:hypothetical protein
MPDQDRFSEHTAKPTRLGQPDHGDDHMHQKNKAVAHRANPTKPGKPSFHVFFGIRHGQAAQSIRNHRMWDSVRPMNQMAKEPFRSRAIAPCLDQDVQNLTVLINCSPQVGNPSVDPNEYLVDMPAPAYSTSVLPQPSGVRTSELATPQPDRFITDDYASRGQQFFNIPERQREPIIKPPHGR